jgi:hypothetical protein
MAAQSIRKVTAVLIVDAIEPCLPLWVDRLGFQKTAEVPEGSQLGFVILARDDVEVMYQTRASVRKDLGAAISDPVGHSVVLFIEVPNLEVIERSLAGVPLALPRRRTFYGMDEIGVREAGGHLVIFAQPAA